MFITVEAAVGEPAPQGLADLVVACVGTDGHAPFEEHTLLTLDGSRQLPHARVLTIEGTQLVGCAVLSEGVDGWTVEAAVHPHARGRGLGRQLLQAVGTHVASHGGGLVRAWVHGGGAAQAALAARAGARMDRRLLVLERTLTEAPVDRCPEGMVLRPLDPASQADRDDWLTLSNAAFQDHPDNGNWTRADLDWRLDAAWTDGSRFPILADAFGMVAGVWTKVEPGSTDGELYVVAVHPRAQGRRLGRRAVAAALRDLRAAGCSRALLYGRRDEHRRTRALPLGRLHPRHRAPVPGSPRPGRAQRGRRHAPHRQGQPRTSQPVYSQCQGSWRLPPGSAQAGWVQP